MNLNGKRALVLGGTSGIGLAAVQMLVDKGAKVVGFGRSEANIAHASAAVAGAEFRALDVLDRDAMSAVFSEYAPIDVLVNAATGGERATGPFHGDGSGGFYRLFPQALGLCELRAAGR